MIEELETYNLDVDILDPWASDAEVQKEYHKDLIDNLDQVEGPYDAIILAVAHLAFRDFDIASYLADPGVVFDVKGFLPESIVDGRL